ncbi:hypothetical protein TGRH88_063600 [Toxoplasma gondii]|uniref:Uncharacterized protein n=1 Tax=Toxoplasma gondii TaxID=5811 RepID=A0A7J6JXD4_TOXGO|nr:hypothetical protein TGRH88_063600 [Toxoplasma gondii]
MSSRIRQLKKALEDATRGADEGCLSGLAQSRKETRLFGVSRTCVHGPSPLRGKHADHATSSCEVDLQPVRREATASFHVSQ